MIVTALRTQEKSADLYEKFILSRNYLDSVCAAQNQNSVQQSLAGLRALLFLLEQAGIPPQTMVLERAKGGKPRFVSGPQFNISHSGNMAVCVLADDRAVGIDVERVREVRNADGLAERFFGQCERNAMLTANNKSERFLEIWTKKEAYLKQCGSGIDTDLKAVDVWNSPIKSFDLWDGEEKYVVAVAGDGEIQYFGDHKWQSKRK